MNSKLRTIFVGEVRGDCCSHIEYEPIEPMTVQELCDYILSNDGEWGYIVIDSKAHLLVAFPEVEYSHGKYIDKEGNPIDDFKFPPHIADAYVKKVSWDGGWSRGDWLITI